VVWELESEEDPHPHLLTANWGGKRPPGRGLSFFLSFVLQSLPINCSLLSADLKPRVEEMNSNPNAHFTAISP
jgi:hypothetical protein